MNILIFFVIWEILWYVPIPPARFRPLSSRRLLSLTIGLFLFGMNVLAATPLSSFVYFLIFSRLFVAIGEIFVSAIPFAFEQVEKNFRLSQFPSLRISLNRKRKIMGAVLVAIFLVSLLGMIVFNETQRVSNASYFNSFIQQSSDLPFSNTIPDNMVRLVTKELAVSIARRHMSEFGSNTQVLDCHITKSPKGKLAWVAAIGSTNIIAENYVKGFVVVDANEPAAAPEIVHTEFNVGVGLWWDRNIPLRNYMADISKRYGVSYLTWDRESAEPIYVVTRYEFGFDLIRRYATPLAYDSQGTLMNEPKDLSEIPDWMSQVYDEDWMESMVNEMGGLRRGEGFDYFSGGFLWIIAPSRDRFEMTEDTRYIVDPETEEVVALICVNPIGNQRTLSGVFKASRKGVVFHDFKTLNYISGMTAEDLTEGRLPKPATGNYYAVMPLLYSVEVSPGNFRLGWYVPVYWYEGSSEFDEDETVYLAGFAIVDAQDTNKIALTINEEGITSEQMVRKTRIDFLKLFGEGEETTVEVTANVLNSYSYVQEGLTHIVLHLDNTTYPWIEATPADLSADEWNQLMAVEQGQEIFAAIEKNEARWLITQFENHG